MIYSTIYIIKSNGIIQFYEELKKIKLNINKNFNNEKNVEFVYRMNILDASCQLIMRFISTHFDLIDIISLERVRNINITTLFLVSHSVCIIENSYKQIEDDIKRYDVSKILNINTIRDMRKHHLNLIKIIRKLNKIFGLQILISIITETLTILRLLYPLLLNYIENGNRLFLENVINVYLIITAIICATRIRYLSYCCTSAKERVRIY